MSKDSNNTEVQLSAATFKGVSYDVHAALRGEEQKTDAPKQGNGATSHSSQKSEGGTTVSLGTATKQTAACVAPPYNLTLLAEFAADSPTLDPCISAMEVNVDGTGHEIKPLHAPEEGDLSYQNDPAYKILVELFREPYPNVTMADLRTRLRRDLEQTGNGYIEVLMTPSEDLAFFKNLDSKYTQLVAFDETDKTVADLDLSRDGVPRKLSMSRNERRFFYKKGNVTRYLREFSSSRDLNVTTGEWSKKGNKLPAKSRAPRVIHFKVKEDATTGCYGLPRWLSQVRSVAGEVEAEVLNLNFFKNGGIPPLMIFLQNGKITDDSRENLNQVLTGAAKNKQAGVVVETVSTTGSLDKAGSVNVTVERFGSDRQKDSMFTQYTAECYTKIRSSYRIPELFLGRTSDYNYATAYASLVVGEAQVFKPERDSFDSVINNTIVREVAPDYVFKSKPLVAVDVEMQKSILELVTNSGAISRSELVNTANSLSNLNMTWNGTEPTDMSESVLNAIANSTTQTGATTETAAKSENTNALGINLDLVNSLAVSWSEFLTDTSAVKAEDVAALRENLNGLSVMETNVLNWKLAELLIPDGGNVSQTVVDLNAAAAALQLDEVN